MSKPTLLDGTIPSDRKARLLFKQALAKESLGETERATAYLNKAVKAESEFLTQGGSSVDLSEF